MHCVGMERPLIKGGHAVRRSFSGTQIAEGRTVAQNDAQRCSYGTKKKQTKSCLVRC
jgi:hypothetical protein